MRLLPIAAFITLTFWSCQPSADSSKSGTTVSTIDTITPNEATTPLPKPEPQLSVLEQLIIDKLATHAFLLHKKNTTPHSVDLRKKDGTFLRKYLFLNPERYAASYSIYEYADTAAAKAVFTEIIATEYFGIVYMKAGGGIFLVDNKLLFLDGRCNYQRIPWVEWVGSITDFRPSIGCKCGGGCTVNG